MRRLIVLLLLVGCTTTAPQPSPGVAFEPQGILLEEEAAVLRLEDRREFDPGLAARWAAHPNVLHRERIALALGRIGTADFEDANGNGQLDEGETMAGVGILQRLAADPEPSVRRVVAFALGEIGDAAGIPTLLTLAGDPEHADVAAEAVEALSKNAAASMLQQYLPFTVAEQRKAVRARAIRYLFRFDSDEASAVAAASLVESDTDVRREAAYALSRRAYAPARGRLELLLTDPDTLIRTYAARGLGRIAAAESYGPLIATTTDSAPWVRTEVARAIAAIVAKEPALIGRLGGLSETARIIALTEDADPGTRAAAVETLALYLKSSPAALQKLREIASTGTRWQRELATIALMGHLGTEGVEPALAEATPDLRRVLLNAPSAPASLRARFATDSNVSVRAAAVGSIPDEASAEEIEIIRRAVADEDPGVRSNAVDRFAAQKSIPAAERLSVALAAERRARNEENNDARLAALAAIAAIDYTSLSESERAVLQADDDFAAPEAFLRSLLNDRDPVVRRAAAEALRITFKLPRMKYTPLPVERPLGEYVFVAQWAKEPHTATIHMARGTIELALLAQDAPMTAWNFARLAQAGYFNGTSFMRVVPNFVVQGGDPRNDQTGGPGYAIRDEINLQKYTRGAVGMALAAPDAAGSQYFITHSPQPHLDGGYTIFARVSSGMDSVVDHIERGDRVETITIDAARPQ
jgi:cyclophilin family peptidyl-prolyl cis-trans isomerase/HEAT repeat protein